MSAQRRIKWNDHADALLSRFWRRNLPDADILAFMPGRTSGSIRARAHKLGLPPREELKPHGKGNGFWTDERKALVKREWDHKTSDSKIAAMIGEGCTRNAVIGIRNRMGLKGPSKLSPAFAEVNRQRRKVSDQRKAARPPDVGAVKAIERDAEEVARAEALIPLRELEHNQCCWPIGDPQQKPFGFCGDKKVPGLPYCKAHAMRAYADPETALRRAERSAKEVSEAVRRELEEV